MYSWRKSSNWESVNCPTCSTPFDRRKNEKHHRTGLPPQYCSSKCSNSSSIKIEKLQTWANSKKNHWNDPLIQKKIKVTKKERYDDENYNASKLDEFSPFKLIFIRSKHRKKHECLMTLDDLKSQWIIQSGKCIYSGVNLRLPTPRNKNNDPIYTASLDRIDSSQGYTKDNIQFVSIAINHAKSNMTHEQMLEFCSVLKSAS